MRTIVNVILFQAAWFAAVLGAANGMPWLGVIAVLVAFAVHLVLSENRNAELFLALSAAVLGFVTDAVLIAAGVFSPLPFIFPYPFSSLWMVMLWVNLAMTLNISMAWIRGRYALSAIFGAVGGPMAYYSGAKLGAMTAIPPVYALLTIGVAWALAFPLLLKINDMVQKQFARGKDDII